MVARILVRRRAAICGRRSAVAVRSGTAATELAICLPVLMLLALACGDFARVVFFHQVVCNAARTGAETAATWNFTPYTRASWEAGIEEVVLAEMQNVPQFDPAELSYELSTADDDDGLAVIRITVSYPFRTAVAWPALPSEVALRKSVEFRQFR